MRKFWRLALFVTAVLSCTFMFVYRQKYNNLNSIMELMNIFKFTAKKNSTLCQKSSNYSGLLIEEMLNSNGWTEMFRDVYAYSPHFISKTVVSMGYTNLPAKELENISCRLWYENHTITSNTKSTFKVFMLDKQVLSFFYMTCSSAFEFGLPYAVTFQKDSSSSSLPVFSKQFHSGSYTACMKPLSSIYFDTFKILEFIIYHSHIGIKHFIFYYTAISPTAQKMLVDIATECSIYIELLPWITPPGFKHDMFKLDPYAIDCIFHVSSTSHSDFLLLLDLDHYIYLEESIHMEELIYSNAPFDFLQLQKKMFCSEYSKNIFAQDLNIRFRTLSKTKVHLKMGQNMNVIYNISRVKLIMEQDKGFQKWLLTENIQKYNLVEISSGVIFSYTKCNTDNQNSVYTENDKMWKFKDILYRDCAYLLSKKSHLIEV